ncbi:hypothetical protein BCR44DRAFT_33974 [Catenaria anguillulae PL171]|uniref:Ankyrin repeat-containing domain protein n=1 Tax=Catenaria anguillulae PL171 TaxID=765915 RepID=A0A1Y2HU97_9FUNG|nr:hypothetical protein BCR44DRAFT_33974 [Catenaria anguillulae PL171]
MHAAQYMNASDHRTMLSTPPSAASAAPAAPPLPSELIELLLTCLLRKTKLDCLWEPEPILQVLNVVSRNEMPNLTKQLLWDFAWIDMDVASRIGDLSLLKFMLDWSKRPNGRLLQYTTDAITHASGSAHIHVLDWWFFESNVWICWTVQAVDKASAQGHVSVLDWWFKSGLKLKYSEQAMDSASGNGHVAVLAWWLKNSRHLKYSDAALCSAAKNGHLKALQWWADSGLPLKARGLVLGALQSRSNQVMERVLWMSRKDAKAMQGWDVVHEYSELYSCLEDGRMDALVWIDLLRLQLFPSFNDKRYTSLLHLVFKTGSISLLEWLRAKRWLRCGRYGISIACQYGHIHVLDYLESTMAIDDKVALEPIDAHVRHRHDMIQSCPYDSATISGHVDVLDWLLKHDYPVQATVNFITRACMSGNLAVVKWWFSCPRDTNIDIEQAINGASDRGHVHILDFLECKGWISSASRFSLHVQNWTVDVLEWWYRRFPQLLRETNLVIDSSMANGDSLEMLDWWVSHRLSYFTDFTDFTDFPVYAIDLCHDAAGNGQLEFLRWCRVHKLIETPINAGPGEDVTILDCRDGLRSLVLSWNWWLEQHGCQRSTKKIRLQEWDINVPVLLLASLERKKVFSRTKIEWEWVHYEIYYWTIQVSLESLVTQGDIADLDCTMETLDSLVAKPDMTFALLNRASKYDHLSLLHWWKETLPLCFFVPSTAASVRQATKWSDEVKKWWLKVLLDDASTRFPRINVDLS